MLATKTISSPTDMVGPVNWHVISITNLLLSNQFSVLFQFAPRVGQNTYRGQDPVRRPLIVHACSMSSELLLGKIALLPWSKERLTVHQRRIKAHR